MSIPRTAGIWYDLDLMMYVRTSEEGYINCIGRSYLEAEQAPEFLATLRFESAYTQSVPLANQASLDEWIKRKYYTQNLKVIEIERIRNRGETEEE